VTTGIQYAGEVKFTKLNLITYGESKGVDITNMVYQMEIYEDIYSSTMSGSVVIIDTRNMVSTFPIIGEEVLELEFETPTLGKKFKKFFYVYKLTNRNIQGDKKTGYQLHFISIEMLSDMNKRLTRSFSGFTHDIVKNIYENELKDESDNKSLIFSESSNKIKYVSNFWNPLKNIAYATKKSMSKKTYQQSDFLFYESKDAFNFVSLSELMERSPVFDYWYDRHGLRKKESTGSVRDIEREYHTAFDLDFGNAFDYMDRHMKGTFSHKVIEHDLLSKTVSSKVHNYWYDWDKSAHLSKRPIVSKFIYFNDEDCVIDNYTKVNGLHEGSQDRGGEIMTKRSSLLSHTELYKIRISVPGRTDIQVGDTVNFKMGVYKPIQETKNEDPYFSGKYLIASIQHQLTPVQHQMVLELVKDGIEADAYEFNKGIG
jgi:hypothetical protein